MKKTVCKRFISLSIVLLLSVNLLPCTVLAAEPTDSETTLQSQTGPSDETPSIAEAQDTADSETVAGAADESQTQAIASAAVLQENESQEDPLSIYEIRIGPDAASPKYGTWSVSSLGNHVFYVNYDMSKSINIFQTAKWSIVGHLQDSLAISKIWAQNTGELTGEAEAPTFGDHQAQGDFVISMLSWNNNASSFPNNMNTTKQVSGCFYLELSNGEIYTLVIYRNYTGTTIGAITTEDMYPASVSIFDDSQSSWLDEQFQVLSPIGTDEDKHVIRTDLTTTDADAYRVQVINEGNYLYDRDNSVTVKAGQQFFDWQDAKSNAVMVNGKALPTLYSADNDASSSILSAPFYLTPGLNVVEVCAGLNGAYSNSSSNQWLNASSSQWTGIVYVIDYDGPAAAGSSEYVSSDTTLAYVKAVAHGAQGTDMAEVPIEWNQTDNRYDLVLPESFAAATGTASSFDRAVLLTVKPEAAGATTAVLEPDGTEDFTAGRVGCVTALALNSLTSGDASFIIRVTAFDGITATDYPVKIKYASSDCTLSGLTLDGASLSPALNDNTLDYYVDYAAADGSATMTLNYTAGASASVDGSEYTGPVTLSASQDVYTIKLTAADGYTTKTYYLVTRIGGNEIPYCTTSDSTKSLAKNMLKYWYDNLAPSSQYGSYWQIFGAKAAGLNARGDEVNFDGKYVYDVSRHKMKQSTDWAACILELVMLGQNPYDYPKVEDDGTIHEHFNYVQGLIDQGGGPFANNVWYMMAAEAAGIDPKFVEAGKENALSTTYDLDTRAWWIAALSGVLEPREMVRYVDSLHDSQSKGGDGEKASASLFRDTVFPLGYDNLYTNGCVLSAIASAGVDIEKNFAVNGSTPLKTLETYMQPNGSFITANSKVGGITKDMIIGLGDILQGSNVWARYALTEKKYNDLISKAVSMSIDVSTMPAYGESSFGEKYYTLYEQVADASQASGNTSMRPTVIWGMPYQLFEDAVTALPEAAAVTADDLSAVKATIDQYEALDESSLESVGAATIQKYQAVVAAALTIKAAQSQITDSKAAELYTRISALPDPLSVAEGNRSEVVSIRSAYDHMASADQSLMDWAGKSVLQKLQKIEAVFTSKDSGSGSDNSMTIHFELLGAPNDGESGTVNTLAAGNLETWLDKSYTFNANSMTAEKAFKLIMSQEGIAWRGNSTNSFGTLYISGIQNPQTGEWLEEFSTTNKSGWMYEVNGIHPSVGVSNYTLQNNDKVIFHYTDDYTLEQGSEVWSANKSTSESVNLTPTATVKDGTANAVVQLSNLKEAVAAAKSAGTDIVVAPKITGTVSRVSVGIDKDALSIIPAQTSANLIIQTPVGNITIPNSVVASIVDQASGSTVTMSMEALDASSLTSIQKEAVGNNSVYDISILSGEKKISGFEGNAITIALPYTLHSGETADGVAIWYLNDGGTLEKITCKYDTASKLATFSTNHLSLYVVGYLAAWKSPFSDVKEEDWFYEAVQYSIESGLFNGTTSTTFSPQAEMTRAMLVTVLYRLEGKPDVASASINYNDVADGQWYTNAVKWATANGIVSGYSSGLFGTNDKVTREQMAAILYRYAVYKKYDVITSADLSAFDDAEQIGSWAKPAIQWANGKGLMNGTTNNTLTPDGLATRAQVAIILMRFKNTVK